MATGKEILDYQEQLSPDEREICLALDKIIAKALPRAEGKVWHGHPVWFIDGNPLVGYSLKKTGIEVLFWSGQSFKLAGLRAIGKFKAAAYGVSTLADLDKKLINAWLSEAKIIQWDYANLPKNRSLDKLTKF